MKEDRKSAQAAQTAPLVSIISPFYNASHWLPGLIECTQNQTLVDFEHLLIDDHSGDDSVIVAAKHVGADRRFRILKTERNGGPAAARHVGVQAARGRYLAFLDADDRWLPTKLEQQTQFMRNNGYAFTYHDYRFLSEDGRSVGALVEPADALDVPTLHKRRGIGCLTVMIDRALVPDFDFPVVQRALPEDHYAWFKVLSRGHTGHRLALDLGRYRVFRNSRSGNKIRAARVMWTMFRHVENNPLPRALYWWARYAWSAYRLHRTAKPILDRPTGERGN